MQRTIVRIIRESILGIGVVCHCENHATALYYLASIAAATGSQLETVTVDFIYLIGSVNYVLEEVDLLNVKDMSRLRRRRKLDSHPPVRLTAAGKHDFEFRLPKHTSYGSLDSWP